MSDTEKDKAEGAGGESKLTAEEKARKKKEEKKKKDAAKKKEAAKKDDKGKPKKHVNVIKELLKARQEEEEKALQRAKEEQARLEAIEKAREEEERLAQEKREQDKLKKKQQLEKLKAEGKYLTPAEREKRRIAEAKLAAAGITIPSVADVEEGEGKEKKKVIYKDKRTLLKEQKRKEKLAQVQGETSAPSKQSVEQQNEETPEEVKEEQKESSEEKKSPSPQDDILDSWELADAIDEIEKEEDENKEDEKQQPVKSPAAEKQKEERKSAAGKKSATGNVLMKPGEFTQVKEDESESGSEDESSSSEEDEESESEEETGKGKETREEKMARIKEKIRRRREEADKQRSTDNLRAPVICVLGHVDTGKTKMLDTIRRTNVQDNEAGGITQQIGATQVPVDAIRERCKQVKDFKPDELNIPGFLIIDTPGHESFANLRVRGHSLCDFAILVVDIMHGLEAQTIESLKLLLKGGSPFVIALNKIDRLYNYTSNPRKDIYEHLKTQPQNTQLEFKERYEKIVAEFAEQGVNVCLSNKNTNPDEYMSIVPTSAMLGDGIGNLMAYIAYTTQTTYAKKLAFSEELDATVMEVRTIAGLGTTIDVILVNGHLRIGDIIVLTGSDGPIMTQVRELLMPAPLKEIRVRNEYLHYKEVQGAQGVKILAKNLEKALAGLPLFVANTLDEAEYLKDESKAQLSKALHSIKKKPEGVYVQASTLGSLEALLEFLNTQKIPYSNVNIGPVHKKDVQKAAAMLEHKAEFACILAFDVRVEREAQLFADREGVKIFQADIIYHLEDNFLKYREELKEKARKEHEHLAIFPCKLRILPEHVFNTRNPIVVGVRVEAGQLKRGTPICVPSKSSLSIGTVSSIQKNHEEVPLAKSGDEICIRIENTTGEAPRLYGRHFDHTDQLVSQISRESIDACKSYFRDDLSRTDWQLIVELKKVLDIL